MISRIQAQKPQRMNADKKVQRVLMKKSYDSTEIWQLVIGIYGHRIGNLP